MRRVTTVLWFALGACRLGFDDIEPVEGDDVSTTARITIQHNGPNFGTVVGPNGFTCTDATCTLEVPKGTGVTLRGLPSSDGWFLGWTSACGGNFDCVFEATEDTTINADFTPTPNRVFVTSTTVDGAFGGIAAADAMCSARAAAAGLSGTYVAYLSDSTTNATTRIASSRGWIRRDGAPLADVPNAFTTGKILFPPRLDEYGNDLGNVNVYTGTDYGVTFANLCTNWSDNAAGLMGGMSQTQYASTSMNASNRACSTQGHILCVETGRNITVEARPNTGKLAFSTKNNWVPGGGLASADAFCASEAASAGLSGTFLAALATTTEPVSARFDVSATYRRVDGVRLLRSVGFFNADWLDVPPELDQFGANVNNDFWLGAERFNQTPTAAENCNDWTDSSATGAGKMHFTTRTDVRTPAKTYPCTSAVSLLCLES
jgi:hypothetical protein